MQNTDVLVMDGSAVKLLPNGKFGGYLVLFGNAKKTDLVGDYFTPDTDYGLDLKSGDRESLVYFDHGLDAVLKRNPVGIASLKMDDAGVWAEGVLQARKDYAEQVKQIIGKTLPDLIAGKKLGFSSGTAPHLIQKAKVGGAFEIKAWPLGIDASLTATPCEPRTMAIPLKSWDTSVMKGVHLGPNAEVGAAMSAVQHLHGRLQNRTWDLMSDEKSAPKARMKAIGQAYDECKTKAMDCINALMSGDDAGDDEQAAKTALDIRAQLLAIEADLAGFRSIA